MSRIVQRRSMSESERSILCMGLLCLDVVTVVDKFPEEDTDSRCVEQVWQRGGNASNSCSVLALLGGRCELLATIADSHERQFLESDLLSYGVPLDRLVLVPNTSSPTTVCIVNRNTGSRTILFDKKNLRHVSYDDFAAVDLSKYCWIHFEGRPNVFDIKLMLKRVDDFNAECELSHRIMTSVELEKINPDLDVLYDAAEFVFVSKDQAKAKGFTNMQEAAVGLLQRCRDRATLICPWGEKGAAAATKDSDVVSSPAFPPPKVIDTLAAGDTFNAATILSLSKGHSVLEAITAGCRVAGAKCGMRGNKGLRGMQV